MGEALLRIFPGNDGGGVLGPINARPHCLAWKSKRFCQAPAMKQKAGDGRMLQRRTPSSAVPKAEAITLELDAANQAIGQPPLPEKWQWTRTLRRKGRTWQRLGKCCRRQLEKQERNRAGQ